MADEDIDVEYEEAECPTCGAVIPADALECPECGQLFEEEEELWEEEEEMEEEEPTGDEYFEEEEEEPGMEDIKTEQDWEGYWAKQEPSKLKLYVGVFLLLFGGVGLGFMSWFHNQIGWYPFGIGGYPGYGWLDQTLGGTGTIITLIGVLLVYLWMKDLKEFEEAKAKPQDEMLEEDFFEGEEGMQDEYVKTEAYEEPGEEEYGEEEEIREMECPNCGMTLPVDAAECPECGEVFEEVPEEDAEEPEEEEAEEMECPNCGMVVPSDSAECPECGEVFEEVEEEEPEEELEDEDIIRCPNCGTMNDPDAEFCSNCEQDLSGGTKIWGGDTVDEEEQEEDEPDEEGSEEELEEEVEDVY